MIGQLGNLRVECDADVVRKVNQEEVNSPGFDGPLQGVDGTAVELRMLPEPCWGMEPWKRLVVARQALLRQVVTALDTGRNFDDTPLHEDGFDDRYEPQPLDPPGEGIVRYGPDNCPICGEESELAVHTDDPHQVAGCDECLEMVAEDLSDMNHCAGHCLHC